MANNLIVINGSTLKALGEIAPLHRANSTQILDHWSAVFESLNAHDLYSPHNCQYTWILYSFGISTSLNCGRLCSQTAARTEVYCCRGTARCVMDTAKNQKDYFQWLQQVCGKVLVFKPYTKISFYYFFTFLPVSSKVKVLTKREALLKIYPVKVLVTAVWNCKSVCSFTQQL